MAIENVPRCQHLKMNGVQCMSPALKWRRLCFFHNRIRREQARNARDESTQRRFELPLLEDANSVQMALMKVMQMLGSGRLDHRTAGLMLYALQTASCNLRNLSFEPSESTDVVIDRDDIHRTTIGGQQWFEEDFDEEDEDEDENAAIGEADEEEAENEEQDDEAAIAAKPAAVAAAKPEAVKPAAAKKEAESVKKQPSSVKKHITTEEARMQIAGVVRNFLLENVSENAAGKPG
jgi:hypothetical protein